MTPQENVQLAVLSERVTNLMQSVADNERRHAAQVAELGQQFEKYIKANEQRHTDAEAALKAHIDLTLPIINSYQQFQGEWRISKSALWLIALILVAIISSQAIDFINRR